MSNLYGLFGEKLSHSLSPRIHSFIFEAIKDEGYYHLFELKDTEIKDALVGLKALKARGINITVPYKLEVMQYLDGLSKEAKDIGAVNTITFKDNELKGYNTDYYGFGIMVKNIGLSLSGKGVVVLGTGGASKAIIAYLRDHDVREIIMVTRNSEKAKILQVSTGLRHITYADLKDVKDCEVIINTTPVGMYPNMDDSPIGDEIGQYKYAMDIIYNPAETRFLREARESGLKTINGLYMLVGQAVKAQEIWNDIKLSDDLIEKIYDELIVEFEVNHE